MSTTMASNNNKEPSATEVPPGYTEDTSILVSKVVIASVENLGSKFPPFRQQQPPDSSSTTTIASHHLLPNFEPHELIDGAHEVVLVDVICKSGVPRGISRAFLAAGPRRVMHFCPHQVNAAIVTAGGLCPGINNVIREVSRSLHNLYGVNQVWGITGGWQGFHRSDFEPVLLTNAVVEDIHLQGGSFLRSSRGGFDVERTLEFLQCKSISQLYIVGGDGTHRAAYKVHEACMERNLNIAVAGIPKTIDNDIAFMDRTFGFQSAVEAAQDAIRSGFTEARCTLPNGIAVIKLMGREAGFLAAFAALGSGVVDAVLVPEVPTVLEGPKGILPFIYRRVKQKKYAVVVVAEGAGRELLGDSAEKEAGSGNKKLPPIAEFIRDRIIEYFARQSEEVRMKYIDPSYLVRSVPANATDSLYCTDLAQNAVHGAFAGFTGFSVGLVNNQIVYIPIPQLVEDSPRQMNPYSTVWKRVLAMTGQPNTTPSADGRATSAQLYAPCG